MIEINLLPEEYSKRRSLLTFDKKNLYLGAGCAVVILLLGALTIHQRYEISQLDDRIEQAKIEEYRYREDIALIDGLTEVKEKILERLEAVERLDTKRDYHVRLLEEFNRRIPEFLWMTSFKEIPPSAPTEASTQPGGKKSKKGEKKNDEVVQPPPTIDLDKGQAQIGGYAYHLNSIGSFMIALMKSDYFDNITLKWAAQENVTDMKAYKFEIDCDLNYKASNLIDEFEDVPEDEFHLSAITESEQ